MFISDFAIRRPIVTIVTMLALAVFGLVALLRLETDEFPDINAPVIFVGVPYPGASPEQVEREVIDRLEDRFSGISGLDQVRSTASDGFGQLIVQFVFEKPVDQAAQDIRDAISAERANLPQEIIEPVIQRFDPTQLPIVSLAITAESLDPAQLTTVAERTIAPELRAVAGVAQVNIVGADSATLNVTLDPQRLAATGVGPDQVVQALRAQNLAAPVGQVTTPTTERTIRLEGRLAEPEDFMGLAVATRDGTPIRLGEVATADAGSAERRSSAFFSGREAIGLDVVKSKGYSTTAIARAVIERAEALRGTLPRGVRLEVVRDAGTRVDRSVKNVQSALVEGAALTVAVVFLFLNSWRSTVITGLALPVSVLASFIPLWAFGFTLNTMSLLGLSLAIGILIDDAIVVRENIVRHVEMGKDHMTAAHEGTSEIGLAVAATTFSIVAVFVPVGFMGGLAGQWFRPFALTIAASVLVSLFVSFSLDPMLSAYWTDPHVPPERRGRLTRLLDRFNAWFDRQAHRYRRGIAWALDRPKTMIALAVGSLVGAIVLQGAFGGAGFTPVSDNSELTIAVETPPGSSLAYTRLASENVARQVRSHPEVAYTYTTVGSASGTGAVDAASIYVRMKPKHDRDVSQQDLAARLRTELRALGGVTAFVLEAGGPGGGQKQLQIQLQGEDGATLARLAQQVRAVVERTPGAVDVGLSSRGEKPELRVEIERGLAGALGVSVGQVAGALRPAFAGVDAGTWIDRGGETRYVRVRLAPETRESPADLARIPLVLPGGAGPRPAVVPLGQLARITTSAGPSQVEHLDRQRVITVGANVEGASLNTVLRAVTDRIAREVPFPPGYRIVQGGQAESQREVFGGILAALGTAIALMYLILVVQFGSFLDPIAILLSLPMSLIGVVLALLLTGDTLNIMSLIGVLLLMGIVAKNAILLIDFAKWGVERGMPIREALIEAGATRLRPILMTTLALIAGMIPVALGLGEGADFRAPLGRAVIGGTITSTVLTLFVIPSIYELFDRARERTRARLSRGRAAPARTAPAPVAGD